MSELSSPTSAIVYFILEFIAVVVGSLAVYYLLKAREKPKVIINTCRKTTEDTQNRRVSDLGFAVSVKRRMVKDARIRCNGKKCSWIEEDGQIVERKDLDIGDVPAQFFPFEGTLEYLVKFDF